MASGTSASTVAPTVISTGRRPEDPGVEQRFAKRLAQLCRSSMKSNRHDDVADDHADQADDAEKAHEAERAAHEIQAGQRRHHAVGHRRERRSAASPRSGTGKTSAMKISAMEIRITVISWPKPSCDLACSPAISTL